MNIDAIRQIGKDLLKMVPKYRFADNAMHSIQVGAAGDKTFPMDKAAEDIILAHLKALNEPMMIVSEEIGFVKLHGGGRITVLVDPIDGSKNAVTGLPFFCTTMAVLDGNKIGDVFLAYTINLISGDEFWAKKGEGAYLNGRLINTKKGSNIDSLYYEVRNPSKEIPMLTELFAKATRTRCYGAMALALAHMAAGAAGVFVSPSKSRPFDFAGGVLLVKEAGGIVSDINGNSIDDVEAGIKHATTILASANTEIHERALKHLREEALFKHSAFKWEGGLIRAIGEPDYVEFSELCGVDDAIIKLKQNTEQLLSGLPANNVLLWGPRGTGKSSCVKALLSCYQARGLKMIEAARDDLVNVSALLNLLRGRTQKFIIFCDDLSFDREETEYRHLKSILEGGLERRPANVLLYATSNRRHLMPELISDNMPVRDANGELHPCDSLEERVSLSDRFGLKVGFSKFDKNTYLDIVNNYIKKRGIKIPDDELIGRAMEWSIRQGGYTGRAARQFVDNLEGLLALQKGRK